MSDNIDDSVFNDTMKEDPEKKGAITPLNKTGKEVTTSSLVRENIKIKKALGVLSHDFNVLRNNHALLQKNINELKQDRKNLSKEIDVLRNTVLRQAQAIDLLRSDTGKSKK